MTMAAIYRYPKSSDDRRRKTLARLRRESHTATYNRHAISEDLKTLAYLARVARPRSKSVEFLGIRFPLRQGLAINSVLDPDTGRALVGAVVL